MARKKREGIAENSVNGVWAREKADGTYEVRYANHKLKRVWEYVRNADGSDSWRLIAMGVKYPPVIHDMRASGNAELDMIFKGIPVSDDKHGWMVVPENEWETVIDITSMPNSMMADKAGQLKVDETDAFVGWADDGDGGYTTGVVQPKPEPEPVTTELPKVEAANPAPGKGGKVTATSPKVAEVVTIPDMVTAREFQPLAEVGGRIKYFRLTTGKARKMVYVAVGGGRCVVAYRPETRYVRGSDKAMGAEVAAYVAEHGFTMAA